MDCVRTSAKSVACPPERPMVLFDRDCRFCRFWIARWQERTGDRVDYVEFQMEGARFPEIPGEAFERAMHLVEPDGRVTHGADAVFRALSFAPRGGSVLAALQSIPGFLPLARVLYRFVAKHRVLFSRLAVLLFGRALGRPTYLMARWVYLRLLGVVFLIAFVSLAVQVRGLVGRRGILPAGDFLDAVRQQLGAAGFWKVPTIFWMGAGDAALVGACAVGAILSGLVILGFWPGASLVALWFLYLSLCSVSRIFLGYQWDVLLLEAGILGAFLAGWRMWPDWRCETRSTRIARWLLLWLVFRLMFQSGVVKIASGDPAWADLSALGYHYETQPLPTWLAWYAHRLPMWVQKASAAGMFAIELGLPFFVFGPRNLRRVACGGFVLLQGGIAVTGNYTFFNFLSIALALLLLDDDVWPARWRRIAFGGGNARPPVRDPFPWFVLPFAALNILVTGMQMFSTFRVRVDWPASVRTVQDAVAPFRSFNGYGLFAVMTTERPEIVVEGSRDGETWLPYEFKWKPGDVARRPRFVAPHQPRLDWQMWFAALGHWRQNPWLFAFLQRLLEGSPEVLDLLAKNPFPDSPPRYVRAVLYDYAFTTGADGGGDWWKRRELGLYGPVLSRAKESGSDQRVR